MLEKKIKKQSRELREYLIKQINTHLQDGYKLSSISKWFVEEYIVNENDNVYITNVSTPVNKDGVITYTVLKLSYDTYNNEMCNKSYEINLVKITSKELETHNETIKYSANDLIRMIHEFNNCFYKPYKKYLVNIINEINKNTSNGISLREIKCHIKKYYIPMSVNQFKNLYTQLIKSGKNGYLNVCTRYDTLDKLIQYVSIEWLRDILSQLLEYVIDENNLI